MKKIILFILLLMFPTIILADEITTFSLNEVTASPGNNVIIKLNIQNKQAFGVLTARIKYDNTKLEYVNSEVIGLKAMLKGADKSNDKGVVALYAITLDEKKLMKDNGDILKVEFKINENVTEDIPLNLEIVDFGVNDSKALEYETKDGVIHVKTNVETVTKDKKETLFDKAKEEIKNKEIEKNDIKWTTSDENIATVDKEGNVSFKDNGNVTIEATDSEGNKLYTKDYYVKDKVKKKLKLKTIIIIVIAIITIVVITLRRKKCLKEKK